MFKPYAGVSTAILVFTKTNSGGTDYVWFYDVDADGWSLDDKRTPFLSDEKLGVVPIAALVDEEHSKNNLPEVLARWRSLQAVKGNGELTRKRTEQSFSVAEVDIASRGYDLSLNRYKEIIHEEVVHPPPRKILENLNQTGGGDSAAH